MVHNKYPVKFISAYDGDTVELKVEIWHKQSLETNLRLFGIDTPEWRTKNLCEKRMAVVARDALIQFVKGNDLYITNVFLGKYSGRVIGSLLVNNTDASEFMLDERLAIPYAGGKRTHIWC